MADQVQGKREQDADLPGFGGALTEAVSHLKDEPLLSFGIAAAIVVGAIATVKAAGWLPVLAAGIILLAVLVAWIARARHATRSMQISQRIGGGLRLDDEARLQNYRGPEVKGLVLSSKLKGRRHGQATKIGTKSQVQNVEITTDSQGPRDSH